MTDQRLDDLIRGDTRTISITNLEDPTGAPAVLGVSDVLRWTAKRSVSDLDSKAVFAKTSGPGGGIAFTAGQGTATITLLPVDFPAGTTTIPYVWDLQLSIAGSPANVRTIARGTGRIIGDVSTTAP